MENEIIENSDEIDTEDTDMQDEDQVVDEVEDTEMEADETEPEPEPEAEVEVDPISELIGSIEAKDYVAANNTFNAVIRNEVGNKIKFVEYEVPKIDEWTENIIEFDVPEGVNKARVVFYKPQLDPLLPSIFLDDIVVVKK